MMYSFWEKKELLSYDVIIVGGGIVGISTAISLIEKSPSLRIVILEKGLLPSGASTKNAGFACFGSLSEVLADCEEFGEEATYSLMKKRYEGLTMLRKRFGDEKLDLQIKGGYELFSDDEMHHLEKLNALNEQLLTHFDRYIYRLCSKTKINDFGFSNRHIKQIVENPFEGQLDTGKLGNELMRKAGQLGIRIITGCKVDKYVVESNGVRVFSDKTQFYCKKLAICTNGFAREILPELDVVPGRGIVLATKRIPNLSISGTFHFKEGYYYFRDYYGRLIFGGGRHLDFETEKTTDLSINQRIYENLLEILKTIILPHTAFEVDTIWAGIMGFGDKNTYELSQVAPHVYAGVRLNGMGVALGTYIGDELSDMILSEMNMLT